MDDKLTIAQQLNIKVFPFEIKDRSDNVIYFESSNGEWIKHEYDDHGNRIYTETSIGTWYKFKYDENNTLIFSENSIGI